MKSGKTKLIAAAIMVLLSLVMFTGASLAWFTLSTAPEISGLQVSLYTDISLLVSDSYDPDKPTDLSSFTQAVSLAEELGHYAPLKPISTYDGVNWFIPAYTGDGQLEPAEKFSLADLTKNANVSIYKNNVVTAGDKLSGQAYFEATNNGYFVYTDFWLMTEEEYGVDVSISVPESQSTVQDWEKGEGTNPWKDLYAGVYGSYALGKYEKAGEDASGTIMKIDNNAQTALRVGFMVDDKFTVWEPNADQRSEVAMKPTGGIDNYVLGYSIDAVKHGEGDSATYTYPNYVDGIYIPTYPIRYNTETKTGYVSPTPLENLIVQRQSAWNLSSLQETMLAGKSPNSMDVATFGKFVPDTSELTVTQNADGSKTYPSLSSYDALGSDTIIVSLERNTPKQIRMYIWLEGQDADCWNDIASGSFMVNIEFAARSHSAPEETPGTDTGTDTVS